MDFTDQLKVCQRKRAEDAFFLGKGIVFVSI